MRRLSGSDELLVGQEVGTLSYFVHDVVSATGVRILSFNAQHLRMISSSRKKTDRRDAYWLARALQTGMMPHPVYIPTGQVRLLRSLLSQRQAIVIERKRWLMRARSKLRASGYKIPKAYRHVSRLIESAVSEPDGIDEHVANALELCKRMEARLSGELACIDASIEEQVRGIDAIKRPKTSKRSAIGH